MSELPRPDGNQGEDKPYESFTPDTNADQSSEAERQEVPETTTEVAIDVLGKEVDAIREQLKELPQVVREAVLEVVQPLMDRVDSLEKANSATATNTSNPTISTESFPHSSTNPTATHESNDRRYAVPRTQEETVVAAQQAQDASYDAFQAASKGEDFSSDDEAYDAHVEARRRDHGAKMEQAIFEGNNPLARQAYLLAQLAADKRTALDTGILKGEIAEDSDRARVLREDIGYVDGKIADLLHKAETEQAIDILGGKRIAVTPISKEVSDFIMDAAVESPVFEVDTANDEPEDVVPEAQKPAIEQTLPEIEIPDIDAKNAERTAQMDEWDSKFAELSSATDGADKQATEPVKSEVLTDEERAKLERVLEKRKQRLQQAENVGVFGMERGSEQEAGVIAGLKAEITDIEARLKPAETNSEAGDAPVEAQPKSIEDINKEVDKILDKRIRDLRKAINDLQKTEEELRKEGKDTEADSIALDVIKLGDSLSALEAQRSKVETEARSNENLSPNLDEVEPAIGPESVTSEEKVKLKIHQRISQAGQRVYEAAIGKLIHWQADIREAQDAAQRAMYGDNYEKIKDATGARESRIAGFREKALEKLGADETEDKINHEVKQLERQFQRSIGNSRRERLFNWVKAIAPVKRENYESDEAYQIARHAKNTVALGGVAGATVTGLTIAAVVAPSVARAVGGVEHIAELTSSVDTGLSYDGITNPRDHMTEDQFREFKGLEPQQQHDTSYPPLTELDPQPGDYNADNIDVEYGDYLSADKVSDYAMGTHLDMASSDTAINGLFDRAEGGPDQAAQMSNLLTNEQIEHFGFAGLTPQQIEERLHDDALRAEVLNTINADYENGSATTSVLTADDLRQLEGKVDNFYNWGAKPIDANGNEISIEQARAQGITDTELVQYQISLQELIDRGASLLKVTNADGETVYFNSLCQNMLTEIPHHDVPIVEEPHHPVEPPTPTEPTHPTEPTLPPEPTPTEPTHPTEPTLPPEPTPTEPTHPTEPTLPPEPTPTPPVTPEPKDPNEDINVNPDLPDQVEVTDPVDSGDHQPEDTVTTPPDDYVEPTPEPSHETAPEAEPVAPDVREDEVQDAPKADDANGPVDPGTQEQLEESGAGQLEGGQGNDGRVEG